ncbi:MAG: hypothetical protein EA404_08765 [Spirochaetaceae bacterium]|nr:MAG: hypothetical protein EA404_08765 [Spirochaetaceae bacterium]
MRRARDRASTVPASGKLWPAVILLLLGAAVVPAQQPTGSESIGDTIRGRAQIVVSSLDSTSDSDVTPRILLSGIEDLLQNRGLRVVGVSDHQWLRERNIELPLERRMSRVLGALDSTDAGVVVAAFYLSTDAQLFVQFVLYDPLADAVLGGVLTRSRQGLTVFDGVQAALEGLEPIVERYIAGGYYADQPEGLVENIRVRGGAEAASVLFLDRLVGRISSGELLVPFVQYEIGTDLHVVAEKPGYHRIEQTVALANRNVVLDLPEMIRQTRFDVGLRWTLGYGRGVGIATRFHIVPDTLFVSLEHYRLIEPAPSGDARDVVFYDYNIGIGRYVLFDYRSIVRLHLGVGFGVVVSDVVGLDGRDYTDWYALLGDPTVELNLNRVSLFARPDLRYALGVGYNTLGRVWIRTPHGLMPISVGARVSW